MLLDYLVVSLLDIIELADVHALSLQDTPAK
jgi:hypothetical protein